MVMNPIFAFDFSCNKPALCSNINGNISYAVFPSNIDDISKNKLESVKVEVFNRNLDTISKSKYFSDSELMIEHIIRARNLAELIIDYILKKLENTEYKPENCAIINEGLSFSSKGNATLDLSGYKYILMDRMMESRFTKFFTYAPNTIKKTAECSKKGMGKEDMIQAAGCNADVHILNYTIKNDPMMLKKKTAWVPCIDDLADAFWCMKTYIEKEGK